MLKKYLLLHLIFIAVFAIEVVATSFDNPLLSYISKPLISLILMVTLYRTTMLRGRFHKRIFTGLVLAMAGDLLLTYSVAHPDYFIYALGAFLLSHISYIRAFYLDFSSAPELDKKGARIAILLCALVSVSFYVLIRAHLNTMKLPVLAYVIVISVMVMMAAFRRLRVNKVSFQLILAGAIFFMLSDALFAVYHFIGTFYSAGIMIILTYMMAQYLIVIGTIERKLVKRD